MIEPGIDERLRAGWAAGIRKEDRIRRRDKVAMETATPNPEPEVAIIMEEKAEKVAVMDHTRQRWMGELEPRPGIREQNRPKRPIFAVDRGRNAGYPAPPAQIRTGPIKASGSYLGCLAAKRTAGQG